MKHDKNKIVVVGAGYVGFPIAVMLSKHNEVVITDTDRKKIDLVNNKLSPIHDNLIFRQITECGHLNLQGVISSEIDYINTDYVIVAVPTDYDIENQRLNIATVDSVIDDILHQNRNTVIVIKSTVPIGYTNYISEKYNTSNIVYCPEFSRESMGFYDILNPSRIVLSCSEKNANSAKAFANLLTFESEKKAIPVIFMDSSEAEAVKLFANAYLAMRVAFFNEMDMYAETHRLNSGNIISGVCADYKIGEFYNNPSLGYGGYCLPKDTKQLEAAYGEIPSVLIKSITASNNLRKHYIVNQILTRLEVGSGESNSHAIVGVYRLNMKSESGNFRNSAVIDIISALKPENVPVIIFEPLLRGYTSFDGCEIIDELDDFKKRATLIISNRYDGCLNDISNKVYTRDLFGCD